MKPSGPALLAVASFFFAAMATLIGALHGTVGAAQLVTVRFAIGAVAMLAFFAQRREKPQLERWPLLMPRALFGSCAVYLYVFAIGWRWCSLATGQGRRRWWAQCCASAECC